MPSPIRVIRAHARRPEPHISVSRDRCFCFTRVVFRRKDSRIYQGGPNSRRKLDPRASLDVDACTSTRARRRAPARENSSRRNARLSSRFGSGRHGRGGTRRCWRFWSGELRRRTGASRDDDSERATRARDGVRGREVRQNARGGSRARDPSVVDGSRDCGGSASASRV